MQNNQSYKEFKTEDEAKKWAKENYGDWLKKIQIIKYAYSSKCVNDLLSGYSGSMNGKYNTMLRCKIKYNKKETKKYTQCINIINNEISKLQIKENIQVWRWTCKNDFKELFRANKIKKGDVFTDKAFMSTTLVADLLENFAKSRKCDCLPKGTNGAYIDFYDKYHLLNECEFLLPIGTSFVLKRRYFSPKYMKWVYVCYLAGQD